jgi:DNA-directed RNA polymerase specialized sigma24 family protein
VTAARPDLDRLLPAIAAGDREAFANWLAQAEPIVRRCLRRFAATVDTEAVLQEALLRTWHSAPRCVPDRQENGLLRLSLRIAHNLAVSETRRHRLAPLAIDDVDHAQLPDDWEPPDPLLRQVIVDCMAALPLQPKRAIAARVDDAGSSPDRDLAAALRMKLNTFLQNITRARKLLADCLRGRGVDLGGERT